ncbi:MAG: HAD family phosphatase [Chloroflexi bacterium]|uniref:HAD family phosphatase n=1 Tax=Candidatus Chlorohelix allophototropha TaxID=3003348 RepID=A0A8T7M5S0_9CHLR|nr:HAD family phosphatase [Chloroflexota bacterium]WJW69249.1 HAD family phosphatase [Chloroflexota bacterium L227-S17]
MIKAIVVDYGGVLVEAPSGRTNLAKYADKLGIDPVQFKAGIFGENNTLWNRAKVGLISEAEYWSGVEKILQIGKDKIEWVRLGFYHSVPIQTEFVEYLKSLKGSYKLAILSNAIPSFTENWKALGFYEWFDEAINSSIVGLAKPDPAVYRLVADSLGVAPEECVFVDDQSKNLENAKNLGFSVIHYQNTAQVIVQLKALISDKK